MASSRKGGGGRSLKRNGFSVAIKEVAQGNFVICDGRVKYLGYSDSYMKQ